MPSSTATSPVLIFDLDDTLMHSFSGFVGMHQRVASELGMRVPSRDELVTYGKNWNETLLGLWPDIDFTRFKAHFDTLIDEYPTQPIHGVAEMLERVSKVAHSMWIVSKRSSRLATHRMRQAGIDEDLFEGIFTVEAQPVPKPDPRCFEPVWEGLGGRRDAIYVGDRHEDYLAASRAGLTFVGVATGPEAKDAWFDQLEEHEKLASAAHFGDWLESRLPND